MTLFLPFISSEVACCFQLYLAKHDCDFVISLFSSAFLDRLGYRIRFYFVVHACFPFWQRPFCGAAHRQSDISRKKNHIMRKRFFIEKKIPLVETNVTIFKVFWFFFIADNCYCFRAKGLRADHLFHTRAVCIRLSPDLGMRL